MYCNFWKPSGAIWRAHNYKYLGVLIDLKLVCSEHMVICKKKNTKTILSTIDKQVSGQVRSGIVDMVNDSAIAGVIISLGEVTASNKEVAYYWS
jgi:hypothetical protein